MAFGHYFLPGQLAHAARQGQPQPLNAPDHQLVTERTTAPSQPGNALSPVTGGKRPHAVSFVAPGGTVALQAAPLTLAARADDPPGLLDSSFAAVMGGTLPYQAIAAVTG